VSVISRRSQRSDLALLWHQVRYEQLSFWRNPQSTFFTFVFPVVIIVIFGALFHGISPLVFISGTYLPIHSGLLNRISGVLPVRPFNESLLGPFAQHTGVDWKNLGVLLAWGVAGALVAIWRFRWNPRPE
jgi:hypothetical protein